jgi:hypothetical protein
MPQPHWSPPVDLSPEEQFICRRLKRTGKFFAFLRQHRHELFDDGFQAELAAMYSDTPRGTPPLPPAMLACATLLQAYEQVSDAQAVEDSVFDKRWQMVLGTLGASSPAFSQGTLVEFRRRLVAEDLDRRLLERTVEIADATGDVGHRQLRVALDSAPLWGAARVEDTFNLIARAAELVVTCAARILGRDDSDVFVEAGTTVLGGSSIKASLDIDWNDDAAKREALQRLVRDVQSVRAWVGDHIDAGAHPELGEAVAILQDLLDQDLEPDPDGGMRIRRGVARERRISLHDAEMRHGRKSKSRIINGYKRHVALDLDRGLILAAAVRPANESEHEAAAEIRSNIEHWGQVAEWHVDRGYLAAQWTAEIHRQGGKVVSKPWRPKNGGRFTKADFDIDLANRTMRCPGGHEAAISERGTATFRRESCGPCPLRGSCTKQHRRQVTLHPLEDLLISLRNRGQTSEGRKEARERVAVEHSLAHVVARQGRRARYNGVRKNLFDLRRAAAVTNLQTVERMQQAA